MEKIVFRPAADDHAILDIRPVLVYESNILTLEAIPKPPYGLNLCVGRKNLILEILSIFLWLNFPTRLDLKPE